MKAPRLHHFFFLCLASALITPAVANSFFCPQTNRYVATGDTADQVLAACGKPQNTDERTITEQQVHKKTVTWHYPQGLVIVVHNGKVVGIQAQGENVGTSMACSPNNAIMIGMAEVSARVICGPPTKSISTEYKPQQVTEVIWTYQSNANIPGTQLIFRGGVLTKIQ